MLRKEQWRFILVKNIITTIHYSSYSFDENKTDIEFLKFFLKSNEFKDALKKKKEQVQEELKQK